MELLNEDLMKYEPSHFFPAIKDENFHSVHVCVHPFAQTASFSFL